MGILECFLQGKIPECSGIPVSTCTDYQQDGVLYMDWAGEKYQYVYMFPWGLHRDKIILFNEGQVSELQSRIEEVSGDVNVQKVLRIIYMMAYVAEYEEGKGYPIKEVLMDKRNGNWEYIEITDDKLQKKALGFIVAK